MKVRRRGKALLLIFASLAALGYYATVFAPERQLARHMRKLHAQGVPTSLSGADFTKVQLEKNSAPQLEKLFHRWMHDGLRSKHSQALTKISVVSSAAELRQARESLLALKPFLEEFEAALKADSFFEKDWFGPPDEIAFPELNHFRNFADIYESAAHVALIDGDKKSALDRIKVVDRIAEHISTSPFLVHRLLANRASKQASNLIEFATKMWSRDGDALKGLNAHAASRSFPQEVESLLQLEAFYEIESLEKQGNHRFEELRYGPQEGWPKREFRKIALSDTIRRGAKVKLAAAWNRLLIAERDGGLSALEQEYRVLRRDLSSGPQLTGRLANQTLLNFDHLLNSIRSEEATRVRALEATEEALDALRRPRAGATSSRP